MELLPYGNVHDAYTSYALYAAETKSINVSSDSKDPVEQKLSQILLEPNTNSSKAALAIGSFQYRIHICLDTAKALEYMHSLTPAIVHRDVRSPNILISSLDPHSDVVVKLSDFGTARVLVSSIASRDLGNPFWLAPEV
jgi:serine/threonine protein kinase